MKALLKISLAANGLLCLALLHQMSDATRRPQTESSNQPGVAASEPEPFHWRQLESTDYRVYIANLRGIGCPEQTVRDIIVADVDSQYAPRRQQLQSHALSQIALASGLRTLQQEEISLLDRLLGINPGHRDAQTSPVNDAPPSAHAQWKSPVQEYITTPLALQNVDPAALKLNEEQLGVLAEIRQDFISAVGGPNQDPNNPEYRQRWQKAQPESDDMLRGMLGLQTWMELEQQQADQ